jgi:hypothetical protein
MEFCAGIERLGRGAGQLRHMKDADGDLHEVLQALLAGAHVVPTPKKH